jgi:hypothetical protein
VPLVDLLARRADKGGISEDPGRVGHVLATEGPVLVEATHEMDKVVILIRIGVERSL